jgi:hypothetical protein
MTASTPHRCATGAVDERPWNYTDVECGQCGVAVQVAKFSLQHTSVQWSGDAVLGCVEFAAKVAAGGHSALVPTCASLRDSIEDAVAGGRVRVGLGGGVGPDGGVGPGGEDSPP